MSTLKRLIRREVDTQRETRVGTVISVQRLTDFDSNSSGVWVVDVEIGANNLLVNLPVKAGASGNRFYAQLGQTVLLRRNAQGRYEVIGPGDRLTTPIEKKTYNLVTQAVVATTLFGFSFQRRAFLNLPSGIDDNVAHYDDLNASSFHGGTFSDAAVLAGSPPSDSQAVSTRNIAQTPFNQVLRVDAAGNPV